jgi:hypothetical protein
MDYETRTLKIGVVTKGESIFHQSMTEIEIVDEAAGEFLKISQHSDDKDTQEILIDPTEWTTLKAAIEKMIKECRDYE